MALRAKDIAEMLGVSTATVSLVLIINRVVIKSVRKLLKKSEN